MNAPYRANKPDDNLSADAWTAVTMATICACFLETPSEDGPACKTAAKRLHAMAERQIRTMARPGKITAALVEIRSLRVALRRSRP